MRVLTAFVAFIVLAAPGLVDASPLLRCQRSITRVSGRLLVNRGRALDRCVAKAMRCPGALTAATAADDACLAAVGVRCRRQLAGAWGAERGVDSGGPRCIAPSPPGMGVTPEDFLDGDGLDFAALAAFCPQTAVRDDDPADVSRCQRSALSCTSDAALATAAPRAPELLVRLGVPLGPARCLRAGLCGNGVVDDEEECDDGAANSDTRADACRTTCEEAYCGDGVVDDGEDCDDGNDVDGDGCDSDCSVTAGVCGNGVVEGDEDCDDGNTVDGDGCDSDCTPTAPECGDGVVDADEECDAGRLNSDRLPDRCRTDCTAPVCGDGVLDPMAGETCEPPGTILCGDDCKLRLALPGFARAGIVPPDDLAPCQRAILHESARLFAHTRALVGRCVAAVAQCVLGIPEARDPDGTRAARCLDAANRRGQAVPAARAALVAAAVARSDAGCRDTDGEPMELARMLDPTGGLGFDRVAADCPAAAGAAPSTRDLLTCVADRARCSAENAVARTIPRAYELLWELDLDVDAIFPCVSDPESE